jgi:hypothetical protein
MKRKIRLTERELTTLIKRMVEQAQDNMEMDMETNGEEEMEKPEVVDLIADFFKKRVLPKLDPEEKDELKHITKKATPEMTESYLNEDKKDRFSSFKEKAMIGGGFGTMLTGMITALGEFTGWSESDLTMKIHEFVEQFGAGPYSGPITIAMVFAGLVIALRGISKRYDRKRN